MIARIWHGYTELEDADEYEQLLREEIIPLLDEKTPAGYHGIEVGRRERGDEVEFVTVMRFDSWSDVEAFGGEDYEEAHIPDSARAVLSDWDETAAHYEVRHAPDG